MTDCADLRGRRPGAEERGLAAPSLTLQSRPRFGAEAVEIKIPMFALAKDLRTQLPLAVGDKDLPRGRNRLDWKREMLQSITGRYPACEASRWPGPGLQLSSIGRIGERRQRFALPALRRKTA